MSKVLVCGVLLLSASCSSTDANFKGVAGASAQAGSTGTPQGGSGNPAGGTSSAAGSSNPGPGTAGTSNNPNGGTAPVAGSGGAGPVGGGGPVGGSGGGGPVGGNASSGINDSVTQRGGDDARTSHWNAPTLTKANVTAKMALDSDFKANFDGEITSSPLFLAGATPGTGRFFAATTQNHVYSMDEVTGAIVWDKSIGDFLAKAPVCGSDPANHGIVSTPIIDVASKTIFVAGAMADKHHEIHALSTDDADMGKERPGWPIDVSKITAGSITFPSDVQNQRSALSLVKGILYVAFGGYCGDAGNYHGWVIGVNIADPTKVGAWATQDPRQAGIWAAGGLASDGDGVFAITGNTTETTSHDKSDSEEIIRITDLGTAHRDDKNMFFPDEWDTPMNSADQDFGSASPTVITVPDATPSKIIVAPAKPGRVYFLDAANLGGAMGQYADLVIADTGGNSVYTTATAYTTSSGVHAALATGKGSQCPGGTQAAAVMSLLLKPGAAGMPPMPSKAWCGTIDGGSSNRAPISTNSSGSADPIVWYLSGSKLLGFDGEDGTVVFDSSKSTPASSCAGAHKFTSLQAVNGRIVAAGDSGGKAHLCSWSVH